MLNKQNERKTMTKYKTLIQYVGWNEDVKGSVKKAKVKKTKSITLSLVAFNPIFTLCF